MQRLASDIDTGGIENTSNLREFVAFCVGPQEFCIDIMNVKEIRGWCPATPLPQAPRYVSGVINLRGAVIPIVEMSTRLGFSASSPTTRHVIIVVQQGHHTVGLLVDAVSDILTIDPKIIQQTPEMAGEVSQCFIAGLLAVDQRMISVVALDQVLPEVAKDAA